MEQLLIELRILEQKIKKQMDKPYRKYISKYVAQSDKETYRSTLDYTQLYYLITLTFDPKISVNLDQYGQKRRLMEIINGFTSYGYYACLEKHKSGILHAHIMVQHDIYHDLQEYLMKSKKHITDSKQLEPAINIKPVRRTQVDIDSTYDYIWDDKPKHPIYKDIRINI